MSDITSGYKNSLNICKSITNLKAATAMKTVQHKRKLSNIVKPLSIINRVNSPAIIS